MFRIRQRKHKGSGHLPATDATMSPPILGGGRGGSSTRFLALPPTEKPEAAMLIGTIISALGRRAPLRRAARLLLLMSLTPELGAKTEPGGRGRGGTFISLAEVLEITNKQAAMGWKPLFPLFP